MVVYWYRLYTRCSNVIELRIKPLGHVWFSENRHEAENNNKSNSRMIN